MHQQDFRILDYYDIDISKNTYIFGTGIKAREIYIDAMSAGVVIKGFVDVSDRDIVGGLFLREKVFAEDDFFDRDANVIIASTFYEQIVDRLSKKGYTNLFVPNKYLLKYTIEDNRIVSVNGFNLEEDYYYVLCPYGLGDTLYTCAYMQAYKKYYDVSNICLITKKSHEFITKKFDSIDKVICDDDLVRQLDFCFVQNKLFGLDNILYAHFRKNFDFSFDTNEYEMHRDMTRQYRDVILGLPPKALLDKGTFSTINKSKNNNEIILMPYANSMTQINTDFWERLVAKLSYVGCRIYTNGNGKDEAAIKGTELLSAIIPDVIDRCANALVVIALRSGMCDLLAFSEIPQIVLYTMEETYKYWNLSVVSEESVNLYINDMAEDELIDCIINNIKIKKKQT